MDSTLEGTQVLDTLRQAVDAGSAGRVFGPPIAEGGVIVLPVAKVSGIGGGGGGTGPADDSGQPEGAGGGFGTSSKGLGVFVLKDGDVRWRPAIDINRIVLGGQIVAVTALLVVRSLLRRRVADPPPRRTAKLRLFPAKR